MTSHRYNAADYSRTLSGLHSVSALPASNKSRALLGFRPCAATCFAVALRGVVNSPQMAQ
jgi:hypothetical protein